MLYVRLIRVDPGGPMPTEAYGSAARVGGDGGAGRDNVGLDAAVRRRPDAGEVRQALIPLHWQAR